MWVIWCKNKCFWKRFTCTTLTADKNSTLKIIAIWNMKKVKIPFCQWSKLDLGFDVQHYKFQKLKRQLSINSMHLGCAAKNSNLELTLGVSEEILRKKIKSFEMAVPLYFGWFLSPKDSRSIYDRAMILFKNLYESCDEFKHNFGEFSSMLNWGSAMNFYRYVWKYLTCSSHVFINRFFSRIFLRIFFHEFFYCCFQGAAFVFYS